jgi:hypothetical protein
MERHGTRTDEITNLIPIAKEEKLPCSFDCLLSMLALTKFCTVPAQEKVIMPTKKEFQDFFVSSVFNVSVPLDGFIGLKRVNEQSSYHNPAAEQALMLMYCDSFTFLSVPFRNNHQHILPKRKVHECILSTHDILRTVGHDAQISWVSHK